MSRSTFWARADWYTAEVDPRLRAERRAGNYSDPPDQLEALRGRPRSASGWCNRTECRMVEVVPRLRAADVADREGHLDAARALREVAHRHALVSQPAEAQRARR